MKKIIFLSLILICFLNYSNHSLKGKKITSYLYQYNIYPENIFIHDNNIYNLASNTLAIQNIYQEKITKEIPNNCYFDNYNIICSGANYLQIYDLNFNFKAKYSMPESLTYPITYKDTFMFVTANNIELFQNNEEQVFYSLPSNLIEASFADYFSTSSNTYLLFLNNQINTGYILNLNTKNIITLPFINYHKYQNGFYFQDEENYEFYDLINNTNLKYKHYENKYYSLSAFQDNILYLYDNKTLSIIDIINKTFNQIKIPISNPTQLVIENNYLYFISDYVYLLDLSKLNLKSISLADYETSNENYIKNTINELKNNYNLNVYVSNNALDFPDFTAEGINETFLIKTSLENLTSIFKKFDKDFYQTFYLDGYKGLNIYLTGNLQPKNLEEQIANPAAYSLKYDYNFVIVIDITKSNLKRNACHELFHNLEFTLTKYQAFGDWNSFNPSDFSYNNSYTKDYLYDYTINEQNLNNIYFIDKYSHTYPEEDRARIFENICAFNYSPLNNFPNLLKKAHYLQNEVLNYYPNLQNIFTSLL